jgi:acyl-CoA thioester hydrolase
MISYKHTVQYYETDKMGIVHHSNYIRWMEEARVFYLKEIGQDYDKLEAAGVVSPVAAVNVKYSVATKFPEDITIETYVEEFNGIRLSFKYVMKNASGKTVCKAHSEHCFLNPEGKVMRVEKDLPGLYNALKEREKIDNE